ncbi:hypothetical protein uan_104 [Pseudomonas phage UAntarctica]|nr:hypothetical protein uan_104 [Pseudomonas phage UAntarctica]
MRHQVQWKRSGRRAYFAPGPSFDSYEEAVEHAKLRAKSATTDYRVVELNGRYKELSLEQVDAMLRLAKLFPHTWNKELQQFLNGVTRDLPELGADELQALVDVSTDYPLVKLKQMNVRSLLSKRKIIQYRKAAQDFEGQAELVIEPDGEIELTPQGAFVQTWIFIPESLIKQE